MEGDSAGVDGCNAGRSEDYVFLLCGAGDMSQECGLTRPRLSCQEKRVTGIGDYLQCLL